MLPIMKTCSSCIASLIQNPPQIAPVQLQVQVESVLAQVLHLGVGWRCAGGVVAFDVVDVSVQVGVVCHAEEAVTAGLEGDHFELAAAGYCGRGDDGAGIGRGARSVRALPKLDRASSRRVVVVLPDEVGVVVRLEGHGEGVAVPVCARENRNWCGSCAVSGTASRAVNKFYYLKGVRGIGRYKSNTDVTVTSHPQHCWQNST